MLTRSQLQADPHKGRFRSYLLGAVKHFLADERKAATREKRGAGITPDSLDSLLSEPDKPEPHDPQSHVDDTFFDRQWALALMERALNLVRNEFVAADKSTHFDVLKPWLIGDSQDLTQAHAATRLGLSETAVKVAIHRLRKRFRQTLRNEIAQTLGNHEDLDDELRYLAQTLALASNTPR
jgi:RNA polymerase sigma-70 factor (ECF subfamily)